jgi:hypothetical protein
VTRAQDDGVLYPQPRSTRVNDVELPLPCEDCGDPIPDGDGCAHDGHRWCGSCFVERCAECRDDLRDQMAGEGTWT